MTGEKKLVTLRDVLYVFFKNKTLISLVFLVAVIGALIYCVITPPKYRAETKILVRMGKAQTSGVENYPERFNIMFQERTQNIRNEMELLRGEYLTEKVVERLKDKIAPESARKSLLRRAKDEIKMGLYRLGLGKKPAYEKEMVAVFMNSLGLAYLEDTDMMRLTFDWTDPKIAALVANTYADEYMAQHAAVYDSQRSYRFYVDQIEQSEKKLKDAENELQEYISKGSIANIELQKDLLLRNIGDLTTRYNMVSVDYAQALTKMKQIRDMIARPGAWVETPENTGTAGAMQLDKQGYLRTLDDAYFKLKVERERMLKNYTPLSNEIKTLDVQLANLKKQKGDSLLNIVGMELALAENKRSSLQKEINGENAKLESINSKTITLKQLQRQKDIVEANYQLYKKKAEDFRISDDLDTKKISAVKVVTPATPPLGAAYPKKGLTIVMAAFLGLFFGFGFSAVREFFNHTFKDENNVQDYLGVPLLMTVSLRGERQRRGFFTNLARSVQETFTPNRRRPTGVPGHFSPQRTNGFALLLVSGTTILLSGYFYCNSHYNAADERLAAADSKVEQYLSKGAITPATAGEGVAPVPGFLVSGEASKALEKVSLEQTENVVKTAEEPAKAKPVAENVQAPSLPSKGDAPDKAKVAAPAADTGRTAPAPALSQMNTADKEHVVAKGESLVGILRNVYRVPSDFIYNESLDLVAAANPKVRNLKSLNEGQRIIIPKEVIEKGAGQGKKTQSDQGKGA